MKVSSTTMIQNRKSMSWESHSFPKFNNKVIKIIKCACAHNVAEHILNMNSYIIVIKTVIWMGSRLEHLSLFLITESSVC